MAVEVPASASTAPVRQVPPPVCAPPAEDTKQDVCSQLALDNVALRATSSSTVQESTRGEGERDTEVLAAVAAAEFRNMVLLGLIFTCYFGFRAGCLVVLPLACRHLLQDELGGAEMSPLYQVPFALWFIMDIILTMPNAMLMERHGRRAGFMLGGCGACVGSLVAFVALWCCSSRPWLAFALLNLGIALISLIGVAEFVRFAADEACAEPARKSSFVSRVITGGAVFSMAGPFSASVCGAISDNVFHGEAFFFLFMSAFGLLMVLLASCLRMPKATPANHPAGKAGVLQLLSRTPVWTSIAAQVTVQFAMVAPMSATSLAMMNDIPGLEAADFRISGCIVVHILCMFLPGLITGEVVRRLGSFPSMALGLALQVAALCVALAGVKLVNFYVALALLGIGWNFAFVAGTMLLIQSHTLAERTTVTSVNEGLRFSANALACILSSSLQWSTLCTVCLVALIPAAAIAASSWRASSSASDK